MVECGPLKDQVSAEATLADPDWFLEDYDPQRNQFCFVHTDRETLARQPFLDHRWKRDGLPRRRVALDAAADGLPITASGPNMIWHSSFCCSTLLAAALDLPGRNLSLREPMALVPVADARRAALHGGRALPPRLIETTFRLLGRPARPGAKVTVKPSNFVNLLASDASSLTGGKALFLYSDLESFLVSVAKSGVQLRKYARRLFGSILGDSGEAPPWQPREIFEMSDLEIAALAWHLQIAQFRRSLAAMGPERAATLDCDALLADPPAVLVQVERFFGLGLGQEHCAAVVAGPLFRQHAKQPGLPFDAQRRREENGAVRAFLGDDLARIVDWSYRACPGTPRGLPLPGALIARETS